MLEYAEEVHRGLLRKNLLSLEYSPVESVNSTIIHIIQQIKGVEYLVLSKNEFLSLISLFNQKPRQFIVTSIFKILLKAKLDRDQVLLFLNCHQKQQAEDGPYSHISWSFLEKGAEVKHTFITFLCKLVLSNKLSAFKESTSYSRQDRCTTENSKGKDTEVQNNISSFDVVQVLIFLLDDENSEVRLKSYESTRRIIRKEKAEWTQKEKQKYKRALAYFGTGSLKVLKEEYKEIKRKKKEIKVTKKQIRDIIEIRIRLGQIVRKKKPRILIQYSTEEAKEIETQRKHTTLYIRYERPITLIIEKGRRILFKSTYSF